MVVHIEIAFVNGLRHAASSEVYFLETQELMAVSL